LRFSASETGKKPQRMCHVNATVDTGKGKNSQKKHIPPEKNAESRRGDMTRRYKGLELRREGGYGGESIQIHKHKQNGTYGR